jgi:hypothetical protein
MKSLIVYIPPLTECATVRGGSTEERVETLFRYQCLRLVCESAPHLRSLDFRILAQNLLEYGDTFEFKR